MKEKKKKKKRISKRRERGFGPTDLDNHGPFLKWEVLRHTSALARELGIAYTLFPSMYLVRARRNLFNKWNFQS